jgi:hypothetical protein
MESDLPTSGKARNGRRSRVNQATNILLGTADNATGANMAGVQDHSTTPVKEQGQATYSGV